MGQAWHKRINKETRVSTRIRRNSEMKKAKDTTQDDRMRKKNIITNRLDIFYANITLN